MRSRGMRFDARNNWRRIAAVPLALIAVGALAPWGRGMLQAPSKLSATITFTHGKGGPERAPALYLVGEEVRTTMVIKNLKAVAGKVAASLHFEVLNENNRVVFEHQKKAEVEMPGSDEPFPVRFYFGLGVDSPPGNYQVRLRVLDLHSHESARVSRSLEYRASQGLAIVATSLSLDPTDLGRAQANFTMGDTAYVRCSLVGSTGVNGLHGLSEQLTLRDGDGKVVRQAPVREIHWTPPEGALADVIPYEWLFYCNRPGQFTIEIVVTDGVTGQQASKQIPLHVHPIPSAAAAVAAQDAPGKEKR
jgi:hypothetical protein